MMTNLQCEAAEPNPSPTGETGWPLKNTDRGEILMFLMVKIKVQKKDPKHSKHSKRKSNQDLVVVPDNESAALEFLGISAGPWV